MTDAELIIDGGLTAVVKSPMEIIGVECEAFDIIVNNIHYSYINWHRALYGERITLYPATNHIYEYLSNGYGWLKTWLKDFESQKRIDVGRIPVDYPVLVREEEETFWSKRHFAKIEDGRVFCYCAGGTSWTYKHLFTLYEELALPSFPDIIYKSK